MLSIFYGVFELLLPIEIMNTLYFIGDKVHHNIPVVYISSDESNSYFMVDGIL